METEKPVALIHSYLYDREKKDQPDRLTRTGILAAAELYRSGKISKICVAVEPNLAQLISTRVKVLLNDRLREGDLVVHANGLTTVEELKTFKEVAEAEGWNNLIAVGNHAHLPRIRRIANKIDKNLEVNSARGILVLFPRYDGIVNRMLHFPEQESLDKQEKFFAKLVRIPALGPFIADVLPQYLPGKIALQSWMFRQIEKKSKN